jgi:type II secretory pathway pseudopilin PulG
VTHRRRRRGYTLFELVLVCAMLLVLAALSVPALASMYGGYKMDAAVDSVRAAWAQARARAIEDGRPYRFAVVPGTGHYRVAPDAPEFWSGSGTSDKPGQVVADSLPKGVGFNVSTGTGGSAPPPASGGADVGLGDVLSSPPPQSPSAYTNPIVFLPNGTAREDAEIVFAVRGARSVSLSLRAMTGVVTSRKLPPTGGR